MYLHLSAIFILFIGLQGFAAHRCDSILSNQSTSKSNWKPKIEFSKYNQELNQETLNKYGFEINNDGVLSDLKTKERIGRIKILNPDYLFQWADHEYHKDIIDHGGIDNPWMKLILDADGQYSGKGFYISLNPYDSQEYGTHLTTFKVKSPIVVFEFENSIKRNLTYNTTYVKNLSKAGIDGIRFETYQKTWLSMISNRHLRDPRIDAFEILDYFLKIEKSDINNSAFRKITSQISLLNHIEKNSDKIPTELYNFLVGNSTPVDIFKLINFSSSKFDPLGVMTRSLASLLQINKFENNVISILSQLIRISSSNIFKSWSELANLTKQNVSEKKYSIILDRFSYEDILKVTSRTKNISTTLNSLSKTANELYSKLEKYSSFEPRFAVLKRNAEAAYGVKFEQLDNSVDLELYITKMQNSISELPTNGQKFSQMIYHYKRFIELNFFKQHNELMARVLFFNLSTRIFSKKFYPNLSVNQNLNGKRDQEVEQLELVSSAIKLWVQNAKDDKEFLERCQWAEEYLNTI